MATQVYDISIVKTAGFCNQGFQFCCGKTIGGEMVICDFCLNWFHVSCLKEFDASSEKFFCDTCKSGEAPFLPKIIVSAKVKKSMKTGFYLSRVIFEEFGVEKNCSCRNGTDGDCAHVGALLFEICNAQVQFLISKDKNYFKFYQKKEKPTKKVDRVTSKILKIRQQMTSKVCKYLIQENEKFVFENQRDIHTKSIKGEESTIFAETKTKKYSVLQSVIIQNEEDIKKMKKKDLQLQLTLHKLVWGSPVLISKNVAELKQQLLQLNKKNLVVKQKIEEPTFLPLGSFSHCCIQ